LKLGDVVIVYDEKLQTAHIVAKNQLLKEKQCHEKFNATR